MIGKTISLFTPWGNRIGVGDFHYQKDKKADSRILSNVFSNGVNKIIEKLGGGGTSPIGQMFMLEKI